jgi:DNA-binding MarR family transcriptional regulator
MSSADESRPRGSQFAAADQTSRERRARATQRLDTACELLAESLRTVRLLEYWAKASGLRESELRLLWCLQRHEGEDSSLAPDQTSLAASMGASAAQVSGLVDRMQQQGWIARTTPAGDRRRQQWQLTPAGKSLLENVVTWLAGHDEIVAVAPLRTEAA